MKTIKPSFRIEERDEQRGGLAIITKAGRICYKSEDTAKSSPEDFVRGLIKSGHNSVLEHGDMIFEIADHHIYENVAEALQIIRDSGEQPPMLEMTRIGGRCIISGNIRAWRELFAIGSLAGAYFIGHFDPVYVQGYGFADEGAEPDPRVRQIHYSDLRERGEKMTHLRQSVCFTVDRGVTHEFVRGAASQSFGLSCGSSPEANSETQGVSDLHRSMSISQESTRFCNYSRDRKVANPGGFASRPIGRPPWSNQRFEQGASGHEITVIEPCFLKPETEARGVWWRAMMNSEVAYFTMLNLGLLPQEARVVLDHSTKEVGIPEGFQVSPVGLTATAQIEDLRRGAVELMMTGNLRAWNHFFDLRARFESRRDSKSAKADRTGRLRTQGVRKSPAATALVESKIQAGRLRIEDSSGAPGQITGAAHPQAVEVAIPLYECDKLLYPGLIE